MTLPFDEFKQVVSSTPLVSIDLVVQNSSGQVLLGLRENAPAQGSWFVPGGRILKGESIPSAFSRLVKDELGVDRLISDAQFHGIYEHHYDDAFVGESITTHYVVLAYRLTLNLDLNEMPVAQHSCYRWVDVDDLMQDSAVHRHSQWYFDRENLNNFAV